MKECIKCNIYLKLGTNWTEALKSNRSYVCLPCKRKESKVFYANNKDKKRGYQKRNIDLIREKNHIRYLKNRESVINKSIQWAKNNKGLKNATVAKRHANKLQATPPWAELEKIKIVYEKAQWLESVTGLKYHVDHIIPLQGKNVCGLHTWENLQILEASINCSKNNSVGESIA